MFPLKYIEWIVIISCDLITVTVMSVTTLDVSNPKVDSTPNLIFKSVSTVDDPVEWEERLGLKVGISICTTVSGTNLRPTLRS